MVAPAMKANGDRDAILAAVAQANQRARVWPLPAPMEAFEPDGAADRAALTREFAEQLRLVGGETFLVESTPALADAIENFVQSRGLTDRTGADAHSSYDVLIAQALFADTGSVLTIVTDGARRLTPYLPRTCIVTARADQLHAHMTARSLQAAFAAAREGARGEAVIITGPSRTADIEKTIVLGAHGPKTLAVFIVGAQQPT